ncbi:hypothetical protein NSK_004654 [Nannochloropsis salina CCMP1776]|uniref:Uncharacterized protein n=1 Tax=Nannochloropsis salina CCMP1776 TaxID=1027361 RepID=A0A4D9CXW1_9STRA|nr:hypothetical protein NSK_004654 [Nannochloropsis salina CCMP1776]|eukprot:TFJ84182.1 hypothetical protein NSK_004654 [Nannochloropsis salina CCMP1776]
MSDLLLNHERSEGPTWLPTSFLQGLWGDGIAKIEREQDDEADSEDPLFHSLVNLLYPHVAADEESDCLAMAARERAYQDAYVRGEIKAQRGGNVLGAPPSPPPSASPSYSSIPPSQASASDAPFFSPNPSVCFSPPPSPFVRAPPTAFTDTEGSLPGGPTLGKRKMGQGPEEKRVAPVSSESHLQICFVLLPLEPFSPSLPPSLRLPFLNAPPAAPPRLVRTTADATVRSIKIFVAARLQLESAAFLDLSVWVHLREEGDGGRESQRNLGQGIVKKVVAGAPQAKETDGGKTRNGSVKGKDSDLMTEGKRQGRRVILDDALTLGDVIEYFWSLNVSEELCLYYTMRTQGMAGRFW